MGSTVFPHPNIGKVLVYILGDNAPGTCSWHNMKSEYFFEKIHETYKVLGQQQICFVNNYLNPSHTDKVTEKRVIITFGIPTAHPWQMVDRVTCT